MNLYWNTDDGKKFKASVPSEATVFAIGAVCPECKFGIIDVIDRERDRWSCYADARGALEHLSIPKLTVAVDGARLVLTDETSGECRSIPGVER